MAEYPFIYMMSRFHLTKFVGVTVYENTPSPYRSSLDSSGDSAN